MTASKLDTKDAQQALATLLADLRNPRDIQQFLQVFLTPNEVSILSNRLQILKQLSENNSYEDIQASLGVSSATISSVAQIKDHPISLKVLYKLSLEEWAEALLDTFASLLATLRIKNR